MGVSGSLYRSPSACTLASHLSVLTGMMTLEIIGAPTFLTRISAVVKSIQAVAQTEVPFKRSLKRFLPTNLGEAEDKRCQLFEP
jgi:hypothetical protein